MSPELELLLNRMHDDIRAARGDIDAIKERMAIGAGAAAAKHMLVEAVKYVGLLIAALFAGHVGAQH